MILQPYWIWRCIGPRLFVILALLWVPQTQAQNNPVQQPLPTTNPSDRDYVGDNAPRPDFVSSARRLLTAPELPEAPDEWITHSCEWVNFILHAYPPSVREFPARRAALFRMDDILHITSAPHKRSVQQCYKTRMEQSLEEIEQTNVSSGVQVWKLYNHGFLIRTKSVSFSFDIVPGGGDPEFAISEEQIRRLAAQSDATFISHLHPDHASKAVARAFLALGKPVIAPPGLWEDDPEFKGKLTYVTRGVTDQETITLAGKQASLKVIAYPGHQGASVLNDVYLVTTPEGFSIAHTGDQWPETPVNADYDFFTQMGRAHKVDILLPNVWTPGLPRILNSVHPKLVITGHENEMGHAVPHREDYTQTYNRLYTVTTPQLVMTWGETYHYPPEKTK